MSGGVYGWLQRAWYERAPGYRLLIPLSLVYAAVISLRRALYRLGIFGSERLPVPVVVVGNIVAGGAGKTPVTLFLAEALSAAGFRPGIVSRGYGRADDRRLVAVTATSRAADVGDEPLLLARRSGCPVVVGRDRVAAGRMLVEQGVDVVIADDGLQHYRLERDAEICVVDGSRLLGNGWLLPAGPLREPRARLGRVDMILLNGGAANRPDA
ncbi:MAG: tetraacyldisaccharide 4'-kinase, partial [Woeseiaceae bacterium]|nr:tetraacyldisaccharide 4'-kinase [Woeseiaceae bacterium]